MKVLRAVLDADVGGAPPLPGFWLRAWLLLTIIAGQEPSNITGEFEPHTALLVVSAVYVLGWGALLGACASRVLAPERESPG